MSDEERAREIVLGGDQNERRDENEAVAHLVEIYWPRLAETPYIAKAIRARQSAGQGE